MWRTMLAVCVLLAAFGTLLRNVFLLASIGSFKDKCARKTGNDCELRIGTGNVMTGTQTSVIPIIEALSWAAAPRRGTCAEKRLGWAQVTLYHKHFTFITGGIVSCVSVTRLAGLGTTRGLIDGRMPACKTNPQSCQNNLASHSYGASQCAQTLWPQYGLGNGFDSRAEAVKQALDARINVLLVLDANNRGQPPPPPPPQQGAKWEEFVYRVLTCRPKPSRMMPAVNLTNYAVPDAAPQCIIITYIASILNLVSLSYHALYIHDDAHW